MRARHARQIREGILAARDARMIHWGEPALAGVMLTAWGIFASKLSIRAARHELDRGAV